MSALTTDLDAVIEEQRQRIACLTEALRQIALDGPVDSYLTEIAHNALSGSATKESG